MDIKHDFVIRPRHLRSRLRLSIENDVEQAASHRLGSQYALGPHSIDLNSSRLASDINPGLHADRCFTVHLRRLDLSVQVLDLPPPSPWACICYIWNLFISFCPTDLDDPVVTVHQSIGEAKEQFYYERTVFLRCVANSNPPVRYSWHRGREVLTQGSDKGVEIYEPFFTQVKSNTTCSPCVHAHDILKVVCLRSHDYML